MKYWNLETFEVKADYHHFINGATAVIEKGELKYHQGDIWQHLQWRVKNEDGEDEIFPFDAFELE